MVTVLLTGRMHVGRSNGGREFQCLSIQCLQNHNITKTIQKIQIWTMKPF